MSHQEQPASSLEESQYWLDSFTKIDLRGYQRQLQNAVDYAQEQAVNQDLPECNRAQYLQEAGELTEVITKLALAQVHLDAARVALIAIFGDVATADWWLFADDLLE